MSRALFLFFTVVLLLAGWAFFANQSTQKPVPDVFRNMSEQIRLNDQGYDPLSPHGQVARPVPPRTVPNRMVPSLMEGASGYPVEYAGGGDSYLTTGRTGGGYGDSLPVELAFLSGPEKIERQGKALFMAQCAVCHGADADGKGAMSAYPEYPVMPSLLDAKYRQFPLGQLFRSTARGQGNMPAFERRMTVAELWLVCAYVKYLQELPVKGGNRP